jgi:hypothetical protein
MKVDVAEFFLERLDSADLIEAEQQILVDLFRNMPATVAAMAKSDPHGNDWNWVRFFFDIRLEEYPHLASYMKARFSSADLNIICEGTTQDTEKEWRRAFFFAD